MRYRALIRLILVVTLLLAVGACGNDDKDTDEAISLSQSLPVDLGELGTLVVHYPEGWFSNVSTGGPFIPMLFIGLATDPALFDEGWSDHEFTQGEMGVMILAGDSSEEGATVVDTLAEFIVPDGQNADTGLTFSDIETFDANGKPAAIASGVGAENGITTGGIVTAVQIEELFVVLMFSLHPDEVEANLALSRAITSQLERRESEDG